MALVNMKMTDAERKDLAPGPGASVSDAPRYPWGLRISLGEESLEKLEIAALPDVGQAMTLLARVEVASISEHETTEGGKRRSMELQITDMGLARESSEKDIVERLRGHYVSRERGAS